MRLLVSVRDATEAREAIAGGADILDWKEPLAGPLGMVPPKLWPALQEESNRSAIPLSIALGEANDWVDDVPQLPPVSFAKLGLAGVGQSGLWLRQWLDVRKRFEVAAGRAIPWIAVAYVDSQRARAPHPQEVFSAALDTGCQGLLLDTWDKAGGRLWDHISVSEVGELARKAHSAGLLMAVAGKLAAVDIPLVSELGADVFAVRSAACQQCDRTGQVDRLVVARLSSQLRGSCQPLDRTSLQSGP